jgi:hypothetical protein
MLTKSIVLLLATFMSVGSIYGITAAAQHYYRDSLQVSCTREIAGAAK